ncbi:hypothetical protein [Demequina salsinemoris]|uniref:hypothetical protein n=1 Tax=Demequina salsinemoris TaxID=577470 RepID=UPI0007849EC3|nr:hypothetical protein [Demequina salsinemoris]
MTAAGESTAAAQFDALRWWLLRWGPRADSGVVLAGDPAESGAYRVAVDTIMVALPVMALSGDFAPADMQYRMHRELLWDEATGLWGSSSATNRAGGRVGEPATPEIPATRDVAHALETALRIGGDSVPEEMRARWTRQAAELREVLGD